MAGIASGRKSRRRTINEINMVPFIDILLVLLIIFMVSAPMLTPGSIEVPTVGKALNKPPLAMASVNVDGKGGLAWTVKGKTQTVALADLGELAANWQSQQVEDSGVGIAADKTAQYEDVVKVLDALKKAGIERVGLTVKVNQGR